MQRARAMNHTRQRTADDAGHRAELEDGLAETPPLQCPVDRPDEQQSADGWKNRHDENGVVSLGLTEDAEEHRARDGWRG